MNANLPYFFFLHISPTIFRVITEMRAQRFFFFHLMHCKLKLKDAVHKISLNMQSTYQIIMNLLIKL